MLLEEGEPFFVEDATTERIPVFQRMSLYPSMHIWAALTELGWVPTQFEFGGSCLGKDTRELKWGNGEVV